MKKVVTRFMKGAIYVPTGAVSFAGGNDSSMGCTKIIGDTVNFTGNSNLAINCTSYPVESFGLTAVRLDL
jgi:hypothetical protein